MNMAQKGVGMRSPPPMDTRMGLVKCPCNDASRHKMKQLKSRCKYTVINALKLSMQSMLCRVENMKIVKQFVVCKISVCGVPSLETRLVHRLRHWSRIEPALVQYLVFAGLINSKV